MLAEKFDVFLFDLDGVIYIGDQLLPGVKAALAQLRSLNKRIYFFTNDPIPTRQQFVARLQGLGLTASVNEIISSGWATAKTLCQMKLSSVYVLGSEGLKSEIRSFGIEVVEAGDCQAVVVGHDDQLTYGHIRQAITLLHRGAQFIATNADASFPGPEGPCPGTGAIVSALQTSSGKRPLIIGKPYAPMFHTVLDYLSPELRVAMVGDNPYTDILGAHQQGITALLRSDQALDFPSAKDFRIPDARISTLQELFGPEISVRPWSKPAYPWPETVEPAVMAVIFDELGRVLWVKRADNDMWGLPTGHIEPGETVSEAIIREVYEETGLQVTVKRYIGVYSDPGTLVVTHSTGKVSHYITSLIECTVVGGNLRPDGVETAEVSFFELAKLPLNRLTLHSKWLSDVLKQNNAGAIR